MTSRLALIMSATVAVWLAATAMPANATSVDLPVGGFGFEFAVTLPGAPAAIYDAATGDISGWWDHSFSPNPVRFELEPRPGGGFWEIFDDSGDGVRHAEVTYAKRGELLRFEGPLGLTGHAITLVTTWSFSPQGADSTKMTVAVNAAGEVQPGWPGVVEATWRHFIVDRFRPYVIGGCHPLARAEGGKP